MLCPSQPEVFLDLFTGGGQYLCGSVHPYLKKPELYWTKSSHGVYGNYLLLIPCVGGLLETEVDIICSV